MDLKCTKLEQPLRQRVKLRCFFCNGHAHRMYLASTWLSKQLWVFDSPVLVNQDSYFVVKCISEF